MANPTRIDWSHKNDGGVAVGSPDPARWESLSFPQPWPDRPWVFGVMVASANGVVSWRRRGPGDGDHRSAARALHSISWKAGPLPQSHRKEDSQASLIALRMGA